MRLKSTFTLVLWFYVLLSSVVSQDTDDCPDDKFFQNSCYKLFTTQYNWNDAKNECATDNAHLVYIESMQEQVFLTEWLSNNSKPNPWIGLRRPNKNGDFVWSDGAPVSYDGWIDGAPDNKNNRDCAQMSSGNEYGWDNRNCADDNSYICEIEVPIETTPEPTTTPEGPTTAPEANMPSRKSESPTTSHATTNIEGTRQPAKGLAPGAIVGVVILIILLLLVIPVVLIVIRSRGNTQTEQTKQEKTDVQLVNGTYDQRIEGTTNHSRQSITQPIYTIIDDNKKPNQYINSSLNISSGVNESLTDENAGVVYEDVSKYENQGAVVNDNDQETSLYYAKSNAQLTTSKTGEEIEADRVNKDEPPPDISGYSAGGEESSDVLHDVKNSHDSKQEGWAECALYGESETDGADDNEEEWAENKIYAGSDSDS